MKCYIAIGITELDKVTELYVTVLQSSVTPFKTPCNFVVK